MNAFDIIDWNNMIRHEWENSSWSKEKNLKKFWNSRAEHFEDILKSPASIDYSNLIVEFIRNTSGLKSKDTILDLGCGTGILTLPLAKMVKKVTALDISNEMLKIMSTHMKKREISNIDIINERWMDAKENLSIHDIVISHRSLGVSAHTNEEIPEYKKCLNKMNRFARKFVFIFFPAFRLPVEKGFYKCFHDFDYMEQEGSIGIATFNLLYSLGYAPTFTHLYFKQDHQFDTIDDELANFSHFSYFCTDTNSNRLKEYFKKTLHKTKNGYKMKIIKRIKVLYWKKKEF
ncbi:methyltransferase domain-containing protein [bacterium]|nr:methyltransferase domain-containing protein [bacterium]